MPAVAQDAKPLVQGNWTDMGAADAKPLVQGNWTDMGSADGGRTKKFRMDRKDIPTNQAAKHFGSMEKSRGPSLFKSKAGSDIVSSKKKEEPTKGTVASLIMNLLAQPRKVGPEQHRAMVEATCKIWNIDMLPTHDATAKNGAPATIVPYNTAVAPTEQLTAMAANAPAPQNLAGEAEFCPGYGETRQVEASGYSMHGSSTCMMESKGIMAMFQAELKKYNMAAQEMSPAYNGHPSRNGSARSSTTFVNNIPVHQAPAATDFAGMAMLHCLEASDCNEMMPVWSSEDSSNLMLDSEVDDEYNPQNFDHPLANVPRQLESAFQDFTHYTPTSSDSIQEVVYTGPMRFNQADNVAPSLIASDHAPACSEDNMNDLTRIFNSANGCIVGTATDGDHSPYDQFLSWHHEQGAEEDARLELMNGAYELIIQLSNFAPQMGQGQTYLPPCQPPAGDGSDPAPLFDTSVQGAMKTMCHRDSLISEISDTRCKMMDTRDMYSHDGNCMQRIGSMVAEDDLQVVPTDPRGRGVKRNYSSLMMEVPPLAGHGGLGMTSGFRDESMTESQMRYMVMESIEGSQDRECHDHAANTQQQVPVMMKKTKDHAVTKADLKAVRDGERYHLL
eukprot:gene13993-19927_t